MKLSNIRPKHRQKKLYSVNNTAYCVFFVVILLIIIMYIFTIENCSIICSKTVDSILSGILSGLLASVIVAWRIDCATCKRKNDYIEQLVNSDCESLKMWLNELFQAMADCLESSSIQKDRDFKSVIDGFVTQINAAYGVKALKGDFVRLYVSISLIVSTIDKLLTGEEKLYMLQQYDDISPFLTLSKSISDLRDNLFNNGNYSYDFIYAGIYDFLSTTLYFSDLLDKKYHAAAIKTEKSESTELQSSIPIMDGLG